MKRYRERMPRLMVWGRAYGRQTWIGRESYPVAWMQVAFGSTAVPPCIRWPPLAVISSLASELKVGVMGCLPTPSPRAPFTPACRRYSSPFTITPVVRERSRNDGVQPPSQGGRIHGPRLAGDFLARAENDQRGNAANIEACRGRGLVLGVQLGEAQFGFELPCRRLVERRHGNAGAAPGCPEVHDNGQGAARQMPVEIGLGQFDRLPLE